MKVSSGLYKLATSILILLNGKSMKNHFDKAD